MDLFLRGARSLVCGGSAGLGAAIAAELAAEGARVAIAARPGARLDERARALGAAAIAVDLATEEGPKAAVAGAVDALGGLDCLLVNSGGPPLGRFGDLTEAEWQRAIDGTLWSALRLVREALPHLRAGRDPAILIILSSSVRMPVDGIVTSNVLRPGLAGLVKSLAAEIAPIRINGIAPGRIATERVAQLDEATAARTGRTVEEVRAAVTAQIPLGRYGDPAEVGRVGAFLLSPAASYLTGVIVPIDGGMIRSLP
ncbi:MAG TPA: SDR family oxidoreductase [Candidatus Binatia bacterium]|nr:SDR family oxidoreductase [Candidatus Binatia bacterium]